jgi:hypothetical protein
VKVASAQLSNVGGAGHIEEAVVTAGSAPGLTSRFISGLV